MVFLAPGNRGPLVTLGDPWFLGLPLTGQGEGGRGHGREEPTFQQDDVDVDPGESSPIFFCRLW